MLRQFVLSVSLFMAVAAPAAATDVKPQVYLETSMGVITLEVNLTKTPVTVANFHSYIDERFYDDLIFHRVMENFMIQGGGFSQSLVQKTPHASIINESSNGLSNVRGTIAMARTTDPASATSQFYINQVDNTSLDKANYSDGYGYCVFGNVLTGLDIVDDIAAVATSTQSGMNDVPVTPVIIERVRRMVLDTYVGNSTTTSLSGLPGASHTLSITVENITGAAVSTAMTLTLYYTNSATTSSIPTTTSSFDSENFSTLAAHGMKTLNFSFTAPSTPGTYYIYPVAHAASDTAAFDAADMLLGPITLTVSTTKPDLLITDPTSTALSYEPNTLVSYPLTVKNNGSLNAAPGDANEVICMDVFISDDPCWADPCYWADTEIDHLVSGDLVDVQTDFTLNSLASLASQTRSLKFTSPSAVGTYYLVGFADSADVIDEESETNNYSTVVTLYNRYNASELEVTKCTVKAGKTAVSDSFSVKGTFKPAPAIARFENAETINVILGTYTAGVARSAFTKAGQVYTYSNANGSGMTFAVLDFGKGTFAINAERVSLKGSAAPLTFEIAFGNYRGADSVEEAVINGKKYMPFSFLEGTDALRVDKWSVRSDGSYNYYNDVLKVQGCIATEVAAPALAGKELTIQWGTSSVKTYVIPALLKKSGRNVFYYKGKEKTTTRQIKATFDFDKHVFSITVSKAYSVTVPTNSSPQNFVIQFAADSSHTFNETVSVK